MSRHRNMGAGVQMGAAAATAGKRSGPSKLGANPYLNLLLHIRQIFVDVHLDACLCHMAIGHGHKLYERVQWHFKPRNVLH